MSVWEWVKAERKLLLAIAVLPLLVLGGLYAYGIAKGRDE